LGSGKASPVGGQGRNRGFMKQLAILLASAILVPGIARAGDKPVIGPPPEWVAPSSALPDCAQNGEAPVQLLLSDQQAKFEKGRQTFYNDVAMRIGTPQGLAAGNISFPWRPETDELSVHKLLIHRGGQVIDVLASGQTFTVLRREQNLESATLDGVLTAHIQPEGLQVGDILQFAVSVTSSDPTLKGHVEQVAGAWNGLPLCRARLRMQWPAAMPARLRASTEIPGVRPVRKGDVISFDYAIDNVEPVIAPKGAPPRYALGRYVELSDFRSWADLGALLAPLYVKASTLPAAGPLRTELDRIAVLSTDPKARAQAALGLVQDKVRYVALAMGQGGLVPADAELTWSRRYGDCKGKTALLLGLLHALGIAADPVAVNAVSGDGIDQRLPMVGLFNHVLVRAVIGGRTYWLDGTRTGDTSLDRLQTPDVGWGLPLLESNAALVRMVPAPFDRPNESVSVTIDATGGLTAPAPFKVETVLRGDPALATRNAMANLTGATRDEALRRYWKGQYDFVQPVKMDSMFDPATGEQRLTMEGVATMEWKDGWYETDGMRLGYKADFVREANQDQAAPYAVPYPYYNQVTEKILLPPGFSGKAGADNAEVDETIGGVAYKRSARLDGNVFLIEKTERSLAPEFPASEAPAAQVALRRLADRTVYLRRPAGYRMTAKEMTALTASTPATGKGYVDRGIALMDAGRFDEAIADFTKAHEADPKDIWPLANRAMAYAWKNDVAATTKDLDAAAAIDPKNAVLLRTRGLLAERQGRWNDAVAAYGQSLAGEPRNAFALGHRAISRRQAGDLDGALEDAGAALALQPRWTDLYLLRAGILRGKGDVAGGLKEAAALERAAPDDSYAAVAAANIYHGLGKWDEALKAYDRALAIKPEGYIYLNRGQRRPKGEIDARRADFAEAVRLDPGQVSGWIAQAELASETGDIKGAVASYSQAIEKFPDDVDLKVGRGLAYDRLGDRAAADGDFAAARAKAPGPANLNNICWKKATKDKASPAALESALADCDEALKKTPDFGPYLDSRGLVLLRLGRIDEAIVDYDRALAQRGDYATSLYGRALTWMRKGDRAKADADHAAALKISPRVEEEFAEYGLPWPTEGR
jgi:tetratricopeptide (TPR) repeat protein